MNRITLYPTKPNELKAVRLVRYRDFKKSPLICLGCFGTLELRVSQFTFKDNEGNPYSPYVNYTRCESCYQRYLFVDQTIEGKKVIGVPITLASTTSYLDEFLEEGDRKLLQESRQTEKIVLSFHDTLGRLIRNEWNLWESSSPLAEHMREHHGISHPDDMSHHILTYYATYRNPTVWDRLRTGVEP